MKRAIALLLAALLSGAAHAQSYPAKPARIVVGFTPGGVTDVTARILAQKLTELWGQTVVVDNRPGASGIIGAEAVSKAPPRRLYAAGRGGFESVARRLYAAGRSADEHVGRDDALS